METGATIIPVPLKRPLPLRPVAVEAHLVRNIFVWDLHPTIAQEVNMKNARTLNRAMELVKRADVAITMSRRPGQRDVGSQEQRKPSRRSNNPSSRGNEDTGKIPKTK